MSCSHDHSGDSERDLCICFHVPRDKIIRYIKRERPKVPSLLSECLSAGTGCGWCVPFLEKLHEEVMAGQEPSPAMTGEEYRARRLRYHEKLRQGVANPRED